MSAALGYAAPLAPTVSLTGATIVLLAVLLFLIAFKYSYDYTLGAFVRRLADMVEDIWLVGGSLASALERMDAWVQARIADGIDSVETATLRTWAALTWVVRETGSTIAALAYDIRDALEGLVHGEIPQQVGAATNPLKHDLSAFRRQIRSIIEQELARFRRGIDALRRDLTAERIATLRGIDALGGRLNARINARVDRLNARIATSVGALRRPLSIRLSRLEALLGAGVLGGVAVAAMTRVFPYWQCTNVRRANRMLCRLPVGFLDDLLGAGLAVLLLSDVCRMVSLMRGAAELALPALRGLVVVVGAATHCTSFSPPPALAVAQTELPASENLVAL